MDYGDLVTTCSIYLSIIVLGSHYIEYVLSDMARGRAQQLSSIGYSAHAGRAYSLTILPTYRVKTMHRGTMFPETRVGTPGIVRLHAGKVDCGLRITCSLTTLRFRISNEFMRHCQHFRRHSTECYDFCSAYRGFMLERTIWKDAGDTCTTT
jgi:hypothetical protein